MRPKTIIKRDAQGRILQVESIVEHDEDEPDREYHFFDDKIGKLAGVLMFLLLGAFVWCLVKVSFMVGYEHGQSDVLELVNAHQVEHGMPTFTFERFYHEHRYFTDPHMWKFD